MTAIRAIAAAYLTTRKALFPNERIAIDDEGLRMSINEYHHRIVPWTELQQAKDPAAVLRARLRQLREGAEQ